MHTSRTRPYFPRQKRYAALYLIFLLFIPGGLPQKASAQNPDSLKRVWKSRNASPEARYRALEALSNWYAAQFDADSALICARLQRETAREIPSVVLESNALLDMSSLLYDASRYEEARASLDESLELCLQGPDKHKLPDIYRMQGIVLEALGNPAKSLDYFKLSYQASLEYKDSIGLSKALNSLGISNQFYLGNYQQAIEYYLQAIAINKAMNRNSGLGNNYYNLSTSYASLGNTVKALQYQLDALKQFELTRDTVGIQDAYNSIGNTYSLQNDFPKAMEYFQKSLDLSLRTKDQVSEALVRINIGNLKVEMKEFDEAGDQLREGVRILEAIGNRYYLDHGYLNLGKYYLKISDTGQARTYLEKAVIQAREDNDDAALASSLSGLGSVAYVERRYAMSLGYLHEAIPFAKKLESKEALSDIYERMYQTYAALGQADKELESYRNYIAYRDSLTDIQSIRETTRQEMEFNFDKKQLADSLAFAHQQSIKELQIRRGRSQRNMALLGMVLLIASTGLVYRQYRFTKKARKRSDELLLNILPAEIAQELKIHGKARARDFEEVSILFTDFKGFTKSASRLSAEELIQEINHCFEGFDHIMDRYGIEKIKTIGDAYMAAGGLPVPSADSCKRTVLAALEMQDFITRRIEEKKAKHQIPFRMRVGIHTGPVVAGIAGVKKFQYDLWGDTVNTASRLESYGAVGKVNISQSTYDLVKDDPRFAFEPRGKVPVKGKGRLAMYFVSYNHPKDESPVGDQGTIVRSDLIAAG